MAKVPLLGPFLMFRQPDNGSVTTVMDGVEHTLHSQDSVESNMAGIDNQGRTVFGSYYEIFYNKDQSLLDELNAQMQGTLAEPRTLGHWAGFPRPVITLVATQTPYRIFNQYPTVIRYKIKATLSRRMGHDHLLEATLYVPIRKEGSILDIYRLIRLDLVVPAGQTYAEVAYRHDLAVGERSFEASYVRFADRPEIRYKGEKRVNCSIEIDSGPKPALSLNVALGSDAPSGKVKYVYTVHSDIPAPAYLDVPVSHDVNRAGIYIGNFALEAGSQVSNPVEALYEQAPEPYPVMIEIANSNQYTLGNPYRFDFHIGGSDQPPMDQ